VIHNPNRLARFLAFLDVEGNRSAERISSGRRSSPSPPVESTAWASARAASRKLSARVHYRLHLRVIGKNWDWLSRLCGDLFAILFTAGLATAQAPNLFQFLLVAGCCC